VCKSPERQIGVNFSTGNASCRCLARMPACLGRPRRDRHQNHTPAPSRNSTPQALSLAENAVMWTPQQYSPCIHRLQEPDGKTTVSTSPFAS